MGQKTQILVIKENNKGEKRCHFFHHQWGFGRTMYLALVDLFLQDYWKDASNKDYNFLDCSIKTSNRFYDETKNVPNDVLNAADINNLGTIREVFEYGDNDNGGLVVYMKERKNYEMCSIKIGFLVGYEDKLYAKKCKVGNGVEFDSWVTPKEYGKVNGGNDFSDRKFTTLFDKFCDYFEIGYIN